MRYYIILFLFITVLFNACEKEKPIYPIGVEEKYVLLQGNNPVDSLIYEYYELTGSKLLYDFDLQDIRWNTVNDNDRRDSAIFINDLNQLQVTVDFLLNDVFSAYSENAQIEYFPLYIFLSDTIFDYPNNNESSAPNLPMAKSGFGYLLTGYLGESFSLVDKDELKQAINISLVGDYMYQNSFITPEKVFYEISGLELYGASRYDIENDTWLAFEENGFFPSTSSSFPDEDTDVKQYITFIASYSTDSAMAQISPYPKMVKKYQYLKTLLSDKGIEISPQ